MAQNIFQLFALNNILKNCIFAEIKKTYELWQT